MSDAKDCIHKRSQFIGSVNTKQAARPSAKMSYVACLASTAHSMALNFGAVHLTVVVDVLRNGTKQ